MTPIECSRNASSTSPMPSASMLRTHLFMSATSTGPPSNTTTRMLGSMAGAFGTLQSKVSSEPIVRVTGRMRGNPRITRRYEQTEAPSATAMSPKTGRKQSPPAYIRRGRSTFPPRDATNVAKASTISSSEREELLPKIAALGRMGQCGPCSSCLEVECLRSCEYRLPLEIGLSEILSTLQGG